MYLSILRFAPIGFCFWFGSLEATPVSAAEFTYDFRGRPYDPKEFRPTGSNHRKVVRTTPNGLRISLPADHVNSLPVGLVVAFGVQGDFEITMDFELLDVPQPQSGHGAGVSLYVTMISPTHEAATIGRWRRPNDQQIVSAHRATTPEDGKRQHFGESAATEALSGKLRLVRNGTTLSFQFAPDESNIFREFFTSEMGSADLESVRIAADNGGTPTKVDVLIKSIAIKGGDLGAARRLPARRARWPWWTGGGLAVCLAVGVAYWMRSRRQRAIA